MADIKIDLKRISSQIEEFEACRTQLVNSRDQHASVRNELSACDPAIQSLAKGAITRINDRLLEEAASMKSIKDAILYILREYENAENRILSWNMETDKSFEDRAGDGNTDTIRDAIRKFREWLKKIFHWKEKDPDTVTRKMEKQKDLAMQKELFDLLNTERFGQERWAKASIEERKKILQEFLDAIVPIYGVSIKEKISFYEGDTSSRGKYNHDDRMVYINENRLGGYDSYGLMQTVIHEMRHAYQHSAVDHPENYTVSKETIRQWENNFKNYKSSSRYDYGVYVSQPVEWDAKNFAKQYSDLAKADPSYKGSWD